MLRSFVAAAMLAGIVMSPGALAQSYSNTPSDLQRLRESAPDCDTHPNYPYIGRVSGSVQMTNDAIVPVSFVGCFRTVETCERWKKRTSTVITSTISQYSCQPR